MRDAYLKLLGLTRASYRPYVSPNSSHKINIIDDTSILVLETFSIK
jgi:hypothetical protein